MSPVLARYGAEIVFFHLIKAGRVGRNLPPLAETFLVLVWLHGQEKGGCSLGSRAGCWLKIAMNAGLLVMKGAI